MRRTTRFFFAAASLTVSAMGCELIATVDRSQIDNSPDAGDVSSSSSSSSGMAGKGGMAGMAGAGGTAGMGGTGGIAGMGGTGGIAGMGGTGGTGGVAGMGGMGGGGGAGGGGMPCQTPTDCAPTMNECIAATCIGNVCGTAFVTVGTAVMSQIAEDCKVNQCDGVGNVASANDDTDKPDDQSECTMDVCTNGVPSNPPLVSGTMCGAGMALFCDGMGNCVGCNQPSDCAGTDTECQMRTCMGGACGVSNASPGTPLNSQTVNDCKTAICNGMGGVGSTFNGGDLPADDNNACTTGACDMVQGPVQNPVLTNDDNACTTDACDPITGPSHIPVNINDNSVCTTDACDPITGVSHIPVPTTDNNACTTDACDPITGVSHTPVGAGTTCTGGGGAVCNSTGTCVQCNVAMDCPGMDTVCQTRTCTTAMCGVNNAASGTVANNPVVGDCHSDRCDGSGGISTGAVDDNDVPMDDGNQCTGEVCNAGTASHPNLPPGTACNQGGTQCDGNGACITPPVCSVPSECPGMDNECQTRTCNMGMCGFDYTAAGTPVASQTPGNCQVNQCNGAGVIVSAADNADAPADDGNDCTNDTCNAGVPVHPPKAIDSACASGGGAFCNATGQCVQCNAASQCAGVDTACQTRTCTVGMCGVNNASNGTVVGNPTAGDCHSNQCDGAGNITTNAVDNTDLPVDGIECTDDMCTMGTPSNPPSAPGSTCSQGGMFCDGASSCVQCLAPTTCPGMDTSCQTRTCTAGTCGVINEMSGTVVANPTSGDCRSNQCDGAGNVTTNAADDTDLPVDNIQCTDDICTMGTPSNPASAPGTPCTMGGTQCDGSGTCTTPGVVSVVSTTPSDGATPDASSTIAVTFSTAMNGTTLTGQTVSGACTGAIQVSRDDFANCIAFSSATAALSGLNTVATLTPAPGMLVNRNYKIRVTTAAMSTLGSPLDMQFTHPAGFLTKSPNLCTGAANQVVISQVYGAGGNAGAIYNRDFVELHNRGTTTVDLSTWSMQYASAGGNSWQKINLVGSIAPGGYYLIGGGSGATGMPLPAVDASSSIAMAGAAGKVALVSNTTTLPAATCPTAGIVDFVGYGSQVAATGCWEGTATTPAPSATVSVIRVGSSCADIGDNSIDFVTVAPNPRNTATAAAVCSCLVENESDAALETDYCNVQSPLSLNVQAGMATPTIYGRIYDLGVTEAAGANANVRSQLGWGVPSANPQYQAGWTWINATYNAGFVDASNDEYQASFTAPAAGDYRYVYRVSLDQGVSWTVCDQNAGDGGAGSNPNLDFTFDGMPVMTVTP